MASLTSKAPWFLWPFTLAWDLVTGVLEVVGRIICAAIGLVLMAVGILISMTGIGAWIGIPLATLGVMLLARALF